MPKMTTYLPLQQHYQNHEQIHFLCCLFVCCCQAGHQVKLKEMVLPVSHFSHLIFLGIYQISSLPTRQHILNDAFCQSVTKKLREMHGEMLKKLVTFLFLAFEGGAGKKNILTYWTQKYVLVILVFGHFWRRSYKNTKILCNLCLHFAR